MKSDEKFNLHMSFSMEKSADEGGNKKPWVLENTYRGLDYGQLVVVQAVLTKVIGEALMAVGIAQAGEMGFDVESALKTLEEGSQDNRRGVMR